MKRAEIEADAIPQAHFDDFLATVRRAQGILGNRTSPVLLSPAKKFNHCWATMPNIF
jgi:hypothetical protein